VAQNGAARHIMEEAFLTYRTDTYVQQALKKQIITVFEPMYLEILNDDVVGFTNITAREMLDHLFMNYCNITDVDLENNFEQMRHAWDPQQPVESLFKQIQDCDDYSEAGHPQKINVGYANFFATGHFMSACLRWNEKPNIEKTWAQFKAHLAAAHRQHKKIQVESEATSGYHAANAVVGQTKDQMDEATIINMANLAQATEADREVVTTITEANARLAKQLEDNYNERR
jgi:hypothetical protein